MANPRPITISSHPNLDPDAVAGRQFPVAWRGYDQESVHRFLVDVGQLLKQARANQRELSERLADAERRAAEPELDEATVAAALGSETARVLHVAHAAANDVVSRAEARAAHIVAEAEAATHELRRRGEAEAAAIVSEARGAANAMIDAAKVDCRAMIDESREVRRRILSDLAERRKVYYSQIEQLRAGKDTLASVVAHVADTIAAVQSRLDGSEEDARVAAEVARRATEVEPASTGAGVVVDEPSGQRAGPEAGDGEESGADDLIDVTVGGVPGGPAPAEARAEEPAGGDFDAEVAAATDVSGAAIVDELFARIREASAATAAESEDPEPVVGGSVPVDPAIDAPDKGAPEAEGSGPAPETDGAQVPVGLLVGDVVVERSELLRRRDELVEAPLAELVHVLKRALRVEQNELLHRLREAPRGTEPSTLSSLSDEAQRLAVAAVPALAAVWREGARFARERMSANGESTGPDPSDDAASRAAAETVATELGTEIATSIATHLVRSFRDGEGEVASLQHAVGAAYRDWKAERIEDTASDYATDAFALGTLEVVRSARVPVSWLVDDGASRCSDCDDNELAGLVEPGATFPTGQLHPPAHGGCRCILVPAGT
jgi:cell division septum initiation protein DivIVA